MHVYVSKIMELGKKGLAAEQLGCGEVMMW